MTDKQWFRIGVIKVPNHQWEKLNRDKAGNIIERCIRCGIRKVENCSTFWQVNKGRKWVDTEEHSLPRCTDPLETPEDNLGAAPKERKKLLKVIANLRGLLYDMCGQYEGVKKELSSETMGAGLPHYEDVVESLETSQDNLGMAVNGCKKSPNRKHMPGMSTVIGHILDPGKETEMYVIDADCVYCGLPGSRSVNPYSFNWD